MKLPPQGDGFEMTNVLRSAIVDHVKTLVKHVFLGTKPVRPAEARWTGVPCVANFCLGLHLFHRMFEGTVGKLGAGVDRAAAAGQGGGNGGDDVDVAILAQKNVASSGGLRPKPSP